MEKKIKKTTGTIVSLESGLDTIKVSVERTLRHPRYEKMIKKHSKFLVQASEETKKALNVGDIINITPIKPISKLKNWKLIQDSK